MLNFLKEFRLRDGPQLTTLEEELFDVGEVDLAAKITNKWINETIGQYYYSLKDDVYLVMFDVLNEKTNET